MIESKFEWAWPHVKGRKASLDVDEGGIEGM